MSIRSAVSSGRAASCLRIAATLRSAGSEADGNFSTTSASLRGVNGAPSTGAHRSSGASAATRLFIVWRFALLGAEHAVTRIAQARQDVAVVVQLPVHGGGEHRHVGMCAFHGAHAFGTREQAHE